MRRHTLHEEVSTQSLEVRKRTESSAEPVRLDDTDHHEPRDARLCPDRRGMVRQDGRATSCLSTRLKNAMVSDETRTRGKPKGVVFL